jgi:hypothetical protein
MSRKQDLFRDWRFGENVEGRGGGMTTLTDY